MLTTRTNTFRRGCDTAVEHNRLESARMGEFSRANVEATSCFYLCRLTGCMFHLASSRII